MEVSMEVPTSFHGSRSNGSRWTLMKVLWKQMEVCNTRGNRWWYVGVYGSSWKLPHNVFVEAAIDGNNGSFRFHRPWKIPSISIKASIKFHGSKSTSTNFHENFHGSKSTSIDFHGSVHGSFHGSRSKKYNNAEGLTPRSS